MPLRFRVGKPNEDHGRSLTLTLQADKRSAETNQSNFNPDAEQLMFETWRLPGVWNLVTNDPLLPGRILPSDYPEQQA